MVEALRSELRQERQEAQEVGIRAGTEHQGWQVGCVQGLASPWGWPMFDDVLFWLPTSSKNFQE